VRFGGVLVIDCWVDAESMLKVLCLSAGGVGVIAGAHTRGCRSEHRFDSLHIDGVLLRIMVGARCVRLWFCVLLLVRDNVGLAPRA
jgi:hypothetical protein